VRFARIRVNPGNRKRSHARSRRSEFSQEKDRDRARELDGCQLVGISLSPRSAKDHQNHPFIDDNDAMIVDERSISIPSEMRWNDVSSLISRA
jgi:hypothetical protein